MKRGSIRQYILASFLPVCKQCLSLYLQKNTEWIKHGLILSNFQKNGEVEEDDHSNGHLGHLIHGTTVEFGLTVENNEKCQTEQPVSEPRSEPNISKIWSRVPLTRLWRISNRSVSERNSQTFKNSKVLYSAHNRSPSATTWSHIIPLHTLPTFPFRSILILSSFLHVGIPNELSPSGLPTDPFTHFYFSSNDFKWTLLIVIPNNCSFK